MGKLACTLVLACAALPCGAQTLGEELSKAGVPARGFSNVELQQGVNAASAHDTQFSYLVYVRVDANNSFSGLPQVVRYEQKSGAVVRKELSLGGEDYGSPLGILFTRDYELIEFHLTPSASMVAVTDRNLKPVEILYGFGMREIAPDEVIFIEDMIHFAPAQQERMMLVDLRSGAFQELYPPKDDKVRAAFANEHRAHMPAPQVCMATNDPCDPETYDEAIEFLDIDAPDRFAIRVSRDAAHAMAKDAEPDSVASDEAVYVYERRKGSWFYCSMSVGTPAQEKPDCQANLAVGADGEPEFPEPLVRKVN